MRKILSSLLVGGAVAAAGVGLASPAWSAESADSSDVTPSACVLTKYAPTKSGSELEGAGGRKDCGQSSATVTVRVAKDVFGPDPIIAQQQKQLGGNERLYATGTCSGGGDYYTWVISSTGNEVETNRVHHC